MVALQGQPRSFLGINLTPTYVSLVEIIDRGTRLELAAYALADIPIAAQSAVNFHQSAATKQLVAFLNQVFNQAAISGDAAVFSLFSPHIFSAILELPAVPDDELASAIYYKARDLVPAELNDLLITATRPNEHKHHIPLTRPDQSDSVALSPRLSEPNHSPLPLEQPASPTSRYLIHAIPRPTIAWYGELARALNLELLALEENIFPVSRIHPAPHSRCNFFVHIDNAAANLYTVSRPSVCLSRTLDLGHLANDIDNQTYLVREIERTIAHHYQSGFPPISQGYLLGRGLNLSALQQTLTGMLSCPVNLSQPFSGLSYPQGIERGLSDQGPAFTVAVGLAERQINIL